MNKKIVEAFDSVAMPQGCENRIRKAAQEQTPKPKPFRRMGMAAAMLVLLLALTPQVQAAAKGLVVKYFFPDSDITVYEELDENGDPVSITGVDTEAPAFARIVNDRLYFLGNGEKIDITDQICEEEPFYYTYVDDYDLVHFMAVGYSGTIENFGIYEFIRENSGEQNWVTGTGRNFLDSKTESRYPWVEIVWGDLEIPWPMPE